jgi:hypothetical protein
VSKKNIECVEKESIWIKRGTVSARICKLFFAVALGLIIVIVCVYMEQFNESSSYICTRCRAIKHAKTTGGYCLDKIEETSYTRWYKHTQPNHQHHWGWCGSMRSGRIRGCGVPHPAWAIPAEKQKEFVLRARPSELALFYSLLESADEEKSDKAVLMLHGMKENEAVLMAHMVDLPAAYSVDSGHDGSNQYRVDPYLRVVASLQALGQTRAERLLLSLARGEHQNDSVFFLCRMLYVPKEKAKFRRPMVGGASFLGGTDYGDWPLEPITLVDGIPFLITRGYALGGEPELPERYVRYCIQNCDWHSIPFQPKSEREKKQALEKLLASRKWKTPLEPHEKEFLAEQIKPSGLPLQFTLR